MLEGRRDQFVTEVAAAEGVDAARAGVLVDAAIDRWVWYAGWSDKVAQVAGSANPVAGPYFNLSVPEPTGVVAVLAPQASSLLGLVSVRGAGDRHGERRGGAGVGGAAAARGDALGGARDLGRARRGRQRADRLDGGGGAVARLARGGAGDRPRGRPTGASSGARSRRPPSPTLTRVLRPAGDAPSTEPAVEPDWTAPPNGPARILAFTETKTVWHPKGR